MKNFFKPQFSLLFLIFIILFSFSRSLQAGLPPDISDASQIKVIDDFNNKNKRNEVGGLWNFEKGTQEALTITYSREDALNDIRGSSLWVRYRMPEMSEMAISTDLNELDISQAEEMRFWLKRATDDEPRLYVVLEDAKGRVHSIKVTHYSSLEDERGWQEVKVPLNDFGPVDMSNLKRFSLDIRSGKRPISQSSFFLDEISFVGPSNLAFSSLSDNYTAFPSGQPLSEEERIKLAALPDKELAQKLAELTWKYFENLVDRKTGLVIDNVQAGEFPEISDYTSPTNIGLYLMACVAAKELNIITETEAKRKIGKVFHTLEKLKRWNGFFYNFYNTTNLQITRRYVSVVDSGWLSAGLIVVAQAFPNDSVGVKAKEFTDEMDYSRFYTKKIGQLRLGYDEDEKSMSPFHYGLLISEARVTSLIAIAKKNVPTEHWHKLYRTPPPEWEWQTQKPLGKEKDIEGNWVFGGMYRYEDYYIVPSWGGSMFEFLMPTLVLKEKELSPRGLGRNNTIAAKVHRDYATIEKQYPVWGLSPCSYPGGYGEFGVKMIGAKGYGDFGVITPHASIVAVDYAKKAVFKNIRELITRYPSIGEYGFYDSIKMRGKLKVTPKYLALDQGMIFIALANYLTDGAIRDYFHSDPDIASVEYLLGEEKYF